MLLWQYSGSILPFARQQAKGKTALSKPQQTRLNKGKAKTITTFLLSIKPQLAEVQAAYDSAHKKDDMTLFYHWLQ